MPENLRLHWLYAQSHLDLRPVIHGDAAEFSAVQPTELADPGEFLQHGSVVLTVGVSLDDDHLPSYAAILADSGVAALGFGTGLYFPTVPDSLIEACRDLGLALFEVPRHSAFISVLNTVRDEQARRSRIAQERILTVQEQLSSAAIRGGLQPLLTDAASHLRASVAVTDNDARTLGHADHVTDAGTRLTAVDVAKQQLRSGAERTDDGHWRLTQAMTRQGERRHLITAVADHPFSQHDRAVLKHVAGLADILLQRPRYLRESRNELNTLAMRLMLGLDGPGMSTRQVLDQAADGAGLVRPTIISTDRTTDLERAMTVSDQRAEKSGRQQFVAALNGYTALFLMRGEHSVENIADTFGRSRPRLRIAVGEPVEWNEVTLERVRRLEHAAAALAPGTAVGPYAAGSGWLEDDAVRDALHRREEETIGRLTREVPGPDGEDLVTTLQTWLRCSSKISTTADALGVHRHTVTTRLERIGRICEIDLNDPVVRAELLLVTVARG